MNMISRIISVVQIGTATTSRCIVFSFVLLLLTGVAQAGENQLTIQIPADGLIALRSTDQSIVVATTANGDSSNLVATPSRVFQ